MAVFADLSKDPLAVAWRSLDGDQRTLPLPFNRPHRQAPDTHNIMGRR
jgi:hypothetical protein